MDCRASENLINFIMGELLEFGKKHHFKIICMDNCPYPHMSSFADTNHDIIYLNTNYYKHRELPFVLGHELGHCLIENENSIYGYSDYAQLTAEGKANYVGLYLLYYAYLSEYYNGGPINVENLMTMFAIPDQYLSLSKKAVKNYVNRVA